MNLELWMEKLKIDGMNPGELSVKADGGDPDAQCYIGFWLLKHNQGAEQEAYSLLEKAAEQKQVSACLFLNELWRTSHDLQLQKKAVEVLERIQDLPEGKETLAVCYAQGQGVPKNPDRAEELFAQVARMVGSAGMLKLARRYKNGDCVSRSITRCMCWLGRAMEAGAADAWQVVFAEEIQENERIRRAEEELQADLTAAEEGDPDALISMARRCADGRGVEKDTAAAMDWLKKAAGLGLAEGQYLLACRYEQGDWGEQDHAEAERLYELAAGQGHEAACLRMFEYCAGDECTRSEDDILSWTERAAALNHPDALLSMALRLEEGRGVERDEQAGWERMCQAAQAGSGEARYRVGLHYAQLPVEERDYITAVDWFHRAAEQGHAAAQYELGRCSENGWGTDTDMVNAVHWYEQAARQGYAPAQNALGVCLSHGTGTKKDLTGAYRWFKKGAEQDFANAQHNLGVCYYHGYGVDKNPAEAAAWFRKGCEQGVVKSQYWLGRCYAEGAGVGQDPLAAVEWYKKAAAQGYSEAEKALESPWAQAVLAAGEEDAEAKFRLAQMLETGTEPFEKNASAAMEWYRAAAELGHVQSMYELGRLYLDRKATNAAVEWYERAAGLGHKQAEGMLDIVQELRDAEAGQAEKQYCVGCRRANEGNKSAAAAWYSKAAEQGHAQAQYALAQCYETGSGVYTNQNSAKQWYNKAADQGHGQAQLRMGRYEEDAKHFGAALSWYEKAEKQGCEGASECVQRCREVVRKTKVNIARRKRHQAAEWALGAVLAVLLVIVELLTLAFCVLEPESGDIPYRVLAGMLLVDLFVLAPWRRLKGFGSVSRAVILAAAALSPLYPLLSGERLIEWQWTWIPVFVVLFVANLLWNRKQDRVRAGVMTAMLAAGLVVLRNLFLKGGVVQLYDVLLWAGIALAIDLWICWKGQETDRWGTFGISFWYLMLLGGFVLTAYSLYDGGWGWGFVNNVLAVLFPALCIALLVQRRKVSIADRTKELRVITAALGVLMLVSLLRGGRYSWIVVAGTILWNAAITKGSKSWHIARCVGLVLGAGACVHQIYQSWEWIGHYGWEGIRSCSSIIWVLVASVALMVWEVAARQRFLKQEKAKTAAAAKKPYGRY